MYIVIVIGWDSIFLSNFFSVINLRKNIPVAKIKKGSVGKLKFTGIFGINTDNSIDTGTKNSMVSNSLSSEKKAKKPRIIAKGNNEIIYESL